MIVAKRKFDFCSIFAKNIHGGHTLEANLRVSLYVSSKNKMKKKKKLSTRAPPVLLYNMGSKVHGHNVMTHFLALLSMLSDLDPADHLINRRTRSTGKEMYEYVRMLICPIF